MKGFINYISSHKVILFSVFILSLNFVLKILFIDSNDVAKDEPFSIYTAQMPLSDIIVYLRGGNNPPLYEILLHFWIKLFGIGAFSVRFPSLIFSCLTAVVIFRIGKSVFSFSTGVVASFIFTLSSLQMYFAHEARVYPLFLLLASLSFLLLLKYIIEGKKIFLILLCLIDILLIYSHYFGFFILLNQMLGLLFYKKIRSHFVVLLMLAFAVIVSFLPMLPSFIMQFYYSVDRGTWVEPPLLSQFYGFINIFINNKFNTLIFLAFLLGLAMFYFVKNKSLNHFIDPDKRTHLYYVFLWFFIPYAIMFAASFKAPMFIDRYVLFTSLFLYLSFAALFCLVPINKYFKGIIILFFLMGMTFSFHINPYNKRDTAKAVAFVKANKEKEDIVLVCPDYYYYAFTYHYNTAIFGDYKQTIKLLQDDNVFLISSKTDVILTLHNHKSKKVIYFQSVSAFVDPQNEIFKYLSQSFEIQEKRNFFEIYTVTVFLKK